MAAFTDDFSGDSHGTALESHTPTGGTAWTLADGATAAYVAVTGGVNCYFNLSGSGAGLYWTDDKGPGDAYVQCVVIDSTVNGFPICLRAGDLNNFVGARHVGAAWQVYKRVVGAYTLVGSSTASLGTNPTARLEFVGNDVELLVNAVSKVTGTVTELSGNTRAGIHASNLGYPRIDDYEHNLLSAGGGTTAVYYLHQRQVNALLVR